MGDMAGAQADGRRRSMFRGRCAQPDCQFEWDAVGTRDRQRAGRRAGWDEQVEGEQVGAQEGADQGDDQAGAGEEEGEQEEEERRWGMQQRRT